jgi:hypothetical protein
MGTDNNRNVLTEGDTKMYEVKSCVCDYAIYNDGVIIPELIFNSRENAEKVCEIMNLDIEHKVYKDSSKTVKIEKVGIFDNRKEN